MLNIFDVGIVLLFVMFLIVGFKRGVIKETVSLVGIILVFILSFSLKGIIGNFLCTILPFFSFSGSIKGMITINIFLYQTIAFLITFTIFLSVYEICLKISKFIQKIVNMTIILWIPSKILGAIVSLLKGYLVIYVVFLLLLIPLSNTYIFDESRILNYMFYKTPILSEYTNSFVKPFQEVYALGEDVSDRRITVNDANLKALDVMLKYNVVSKGTITTLINIHKLDTVRNIDSVLDRY